jgi:hypothetical protein
MARVGRPFTWCRVDRWRWRCIEVRLPRGPHKLAIVLARCMELTADGRLYLTCYPAQRYLADALGCDRTGVKRWLDALASAGLLRIIEPGGGHGRLTVYQGLLEPISQGSNRSKIDPSAQGSNPAKSDPSIEPAFRAAPGGKIDMSQGSKSAPLRGQTRARSRERETKGNEERGEKGGQAGSPPPTHEEADTCFVGPGEGAPRLAEIASLERRPSAEDAFQVEAEFTVRPGVRRWIEWASTCKYPEPLRQSLLRQMNSPEWQALSDAEHAAMETTASRQIAALHATLTGTESLRRASPAAR